MSEPVCYIASAQTERQKGLRTSITVKSSPASIRLFSSSTAIRGASVIENLLSGFPICCDCVGRANGVTPFALAFIQRSDQFLNQRIKLAGVGLVRYSSTQFAPIPLLVSGHSAPPASKS